MNIPGYEHLCEIYEGAISKVYKGLRSQDAKPVILKLLKERRVSAAGLSAFKHEFTVTRSLQIDCVAKVLELMQFKNTLVLVFEDFGGESLSHFMDSRETSLEVFLNIALKMTDAIGKIHAAGITHKDINPSNILIHPESGQLKIIDFGISTALSSQTPLRDPLEGLRGTLAYMSPEQTGRMNRNVDYRSDFYSLGVTLYEMLCRKMPFEHKDSLDLVHAHIAKMPKAPNEVDPNIPVPVSNIIMKLMAKNAEDRYQSSQGILSDIEECISRLNKTGHIETFELARCDIPDRFQLSGKIFGRENEIRTVLDGFQRVAGGERNVLFIKGVPGVGKTSLVREAYKRATRNRAQKQKKIRFIYGKFDLFQRNIPYSAVVNAFRELVRQLLSESDIDLERWRKKLLAPLGLNGRVVTDVIPELELIVGQQPALTALGPLETQNRFNLVFQKFIRSICQSEEPLVIFLDDLQWADAASLKMIELMAVDAKLRHLFLINAFRDNEAGSDSPFTRFMDSLKKNGTCFDVIDLRPFDEEQNCELIANWLSGEKKQIQPLADLIYRKAVGNPFFSEILLKAFHTQELISFDYETGKWTWKLNQIQNRNLTDNVVELIADKIRQLRPQTQKMLQQAACIGNQFELQILAGICDMSVEDTATSLQEAVASGMLLPLGDTRNILMSPIDEPADEYIFIHDRTQQAAYRSIDEKSQRLYHQKIGRHFLENIPGNRKNEKLFDIVDHLNIGRDLIESQPDRDELAKLNLKAGRKAKASAAFESAMNYFRIGTRLLGENGWKTQYETTMAIHVEASEAAYLCAAYEEMDRIIDTVLLNAKNKIDKVHVYKVQIDAYKSRYKLQKALQTAIPELKMLGVNLPAKVNNLHLLAEFVKSKVLLSHRRIEELVDLPELNDPIKLAALQLMMRASSAAYFADTNLFPLIIIKAVIISVKHGNATESAFVYAVYGLILCGVVGDIPTGNKFGQVAMQLVDKLQSRDIKARTNFMVSGFIMHWTKHIRETLELLSSAFECGQETGDFEYASFSGFFYALYLLITGSKLAEVEHVMTRQKDTIVQLKHEPSIHMHDLYHQVVQNLSGKNEDPTGLNGEYYDEKVRHPIHIKANDRTTLCNLNFSKLYLFYIFGDPVKAVDSSDLAGKYLDGVVGTPIVPLFYFYDSLSRLALYGESNFAKQSQILKRVRANQKKMKKWAFHAPMNYSHKLILIEAETYRILGKNYQAGECYHLAVEKAGENGYLNEEALSNELAGEFYLKIGKPTIAGAYLKEAWDCYRRWGAIAKIKELEKRHSIYLANQSNDISPENSKNIKYSEKNANTITEENLDLAAVMKATQAISGEILMAHLLQQLMSIIIANAGAQRAFLILNIEGKLKIEASINSDPPRIHVLQSQSIEQHADFSLEIVRYVFRSAEDLVIDNGSEMEQFEWDEYIVKNAPKSILCMPIRRKDETSGVLYLENNLTTAAFTEERIKVLRILLSQAAISIENARLYESLKQEINDRKQAQEDLLHLATAIEQAAEGIVITEKNGTVRYSNPAFEKITGYSQYEIKGQNISVLSKEQYDEVFYDRMLSSVLSGKIWSGRIAAEKKDALSCQLEVTFSPVRDSDDNVISFVAVYRDVTRELQMEKELRQSQKMEAIGTLAGGIAHDFNNILAAILGYTELSILDLPADSSALRKLKEVIKASERARQLVNQILSFSRKNEQEVKSVEPALIISESLNLLRASLPSTIEIKTHIEASGAMILADPSQVHQVVMNLCTNAAHAMRTHGGTLEIGLFHESIDAQSPCIDQQLRSGRYLRLTVKDTGHGIQPSLLARVFEPFFTTKEPGEGTGMGLAVVHGIIKRMKGAISVESEPQVGTTFHVLLPLLDQEFAPIEKPQTKKLRMGKESILVIDDEEQIIEFTSQILSKLGYKVTTKNSGLSAMELIKEKPNSFDLIITDQTMPKMSGFDFAKACIRIRPDIPIILCSGYTESVSLEELRKFGIQDFINKPFTMEFMAEKIREVMDRKQFML